MASLKQRIASAGLALMAVSLAVFVCSLLAGPGIHQLKEKQRQKTDRIETYRQLLRDRQAIETQWKKQEIDFKTATSVEALNLWVKALIAVAEGQGIVIEKLEPKQTKDREGQEKIGVYMTFKGDIRKFVRFLYALREQDPLSYVEEFRIDQEEGAKVFRYEMSLARGGQ
jgi:hypothetical protein